MILGISKEEMNQPFRKTIAIPYSIYVKLERKKKPSESILDLINRLVEVDDTPLEDKYRDNEYTKELFLKAQQLKGETSIFDKKRIL